MRRAVALRPRPVNDWLDSVEPTSGGRTEETMNANEFTAVSGPPLMPIDPGRFEIGELLGVGGMGEVRVARDNRIGREVAIKALRREDPKGVLYSRFLREVRIQAILDHPAVVPVYDLGLDQTGAPYFAMKRLTGVTLDRVLSYQRMGSPGAAAWTRRMLLSRFVDVCLALEFAHRRGVVHRDIKPANIVLGDFGEVYVLDWGIARLIDEDIVPGLQHGPSIEPCGLRTGEGLMCGTLGYMSPEQLRGEAADPRADVYALGCMLFEMLTLQPGLPRSREAPITKEPLSPRRRAPGLDIPPELDLICQRATAPDREDRFCSARELAAGLQRFLEGDRDVERRRELATELAWSARAQLSISDGQGEKSAMRDAGRALALDPENPEVQDLVGQLLFAPRAVPPEVDHKIERDGVRVGKSQLRMGAAVYATYLVVLAALWLGVDQSPWLLGLSGAVATNLLVFILAAMRNRPLGSLFLPGLILHAGTIGLACVVLSPLLVIPALVVGSIAGFLSQPSSFRPVAVVFVHIACVLVPIGLELQGVVPRTFSFGGDSLHIHPWAVQLSAVSSLLVLVVATLVQLFGTAALVIQLRRAKTNAERALHVQLWQLRQLVPDPTADRR